MSKLKVVLSDITDNFDNIRVPLSSKERAKIDKVYPYYGAQGIIDYVDDYLFNGEYILVAEDGENLKSQNNAVCNLVNGKFWVNNHAHIIRAKEGFSNKYICYYLNLIDYKPFITGSAQPKLTKENLNNIPLIIHDKVEQQKIASVLSSLDTKIALNNRINGELEAMAKTLYDYWFVQFDFPNEEGKPYKAAGGKMVYNNQLKREIPEGWEVKRIGDLGKVITGKTPSTNISEYWGTEVPFITPTDFKSKVKFFNSSERFLSSKGRNSVKNLLLPKDSIIVTCIGSDMGKVAYNATECVTNQQINAILIHNKDFGEVLYQFLVSIYDYLTRIANAGSTMPIINKTTFEEIITVYPSETLISSFYKKVIVSNEKIKSNIKQNQQLSSLRDWLLPMLMNGQVTVREAEQRVGEVL